MARSSDASALQHWTRNDRKRLVQSWNSSATVAEQASNQNKRDNDGKRDEYKSGECDEDKDEEDEASNVASSMLHCTPSDRLLQWLRHEQSVSAVTLLASDWTSAPAQCADRDTEVNKIDALPLTSGQVQRAYRTRAQQQEVRELTRAQATAAARKQLQESAVRGRTRHQALVVPRRRSSRHVLEETQVSGCIDVHEQQQRQQPPPQQHQEKQFASDALVTTFADLPASQLCGDATLRRDMLAAIRQALAAGRDVLLAARATDAASDARLALQQLCTQSLAFCVREQGLVPTSDASGRPLQLLLQSRVRARTSQS